MQTYVGYGINTNDIPDEDWLALAKKYDKETFETYLRSTYKEEPDKTDEKDQVQDALDFIEKNSSSRCEYLRDIINENEKEKAGTDYIVTNYDNYLVFDSIRFADDSKRTKYIRTEADFINMIGRYIPLENGKLTFGNLCEGSDWFDPVYSLE